MRWSWSIGGLSSNEEKEAVYGRYEEFLRITNYKNISWSLCCGKFEIKSAEFLLSAIVQLKNEQQKVTENYTMRDFITVSTPCAYFYGVTKRFGLAGHITHIGEFNTRIL